MSIHAQERNDVIRNPQKFVDDLTIIRDFLWENLQAWWNNALDQIIIKLKKFVFTNSQIDSVAPSEIVEELWSILRQAEAKYLKFPKFAFQDHQDSSIHDSVEKYLNSLLVYIENYREDIDPERTFVSEDAALKYLKKCGIGNVKSVGLNFMNDNTIRDITSDGNLPLTGLEYINKKFAGLWNVWKVFLSPESVTFRSLEWTQIEWLGTLDNTISGISNVWNADYNVDQWYIDSIWSNTDKNLTFTNPIWWLDLSKIAWVGTCTFDEQKRIKMITFLNEWVIWLEETWLGILSNELSKSENLKNVKILWFSYESNEVVVEYFDQYEAKFFPIW